MFRKNGVWVNSSRLAGVFLLVCLVGSPTARAQGEGDNAETVAPIEAIDASEASLEFTFVPGVWIPRLNGQAGLDGPQISLEDGINMRGREPTFLLEASLVKDRHWQIFASGFNFEVSSSGQFANTANFGDLFLQPGDSYNAEFDFWSVGFEVVRHFYVPAYEDNPNVLLRGGPVVGARYLDVDQTVNQVGVATENTGGSWLGLYFGLQFDIGWKPESLPLIHDFKLTANASVGPAIGGGSGFTWQVRAGLETYFTQNFGFQFGFRLLQIDADNGSYDLDGGLQGLFLAATIRF